ncbi:phage terminase large subunit [Oceanobacillus sojae]|uniref:phage terminase large subunit n=1 Tax=Oceanobacillus sojae TaxID=582851 RepID=UPI00098848A5|nr:phage terminase large subunit [Oceanobacillus sojae]
MAYVNGEWLEYEARAQYLADLEEEKALLVKLIEQGNAIEVDIVRLEYVLDELERVQRVHRGEYDVLYFTYQYFSAEDNPDNDSNLIPIGQHYLNAADFHRELCSILDSVTKGEVVTNLAYSVGRRHAKTAYLSNAFLCHQVVYRRKRYIVEVSETTDVAGDFITWTRHQLKFNEKLRDDFGELLNPRSTMNELDNKYEFITSSGTKVTAKGVGTQMRGLRYLSVRPDLFILDDLESQDNTNTPEMRAKNLHWFRAEMLEALGFGGMCIYMGTIVHYDSLLNHVINKRKDFTSRKFPAILSWADNEQLWEEWRSIYNADDPKAKANADAFYEANKDELTAGTSVLWDEMYSYKYFMEKREEMGARAFNQEYLGNPVDEESQIFNPENFRFFDEEDLENEQLTYYAAIDLAMGKSARGDYSAIITLAKKPDSQVVYVVDAYLAKIKPDEFMQEIIKRTFHYQYESLAVESQQFQEWFSDKLGEELQARGYPAHTRLKQVKQKMRKELRIEALEPEINAGRIRFKREQRLLLEMLELFPNHNHDDGPDALADAYKIARETGGKVRTVKRMNRWR